jgi:hypothetical protein
MLQPTLDICIKVSNFDFNLPAPAAPFKKEPVQRQKEVTRYDLSPIGSTPMVARHPLIIDSEEECAELQCEIDGESLKLRAELKRVFPQDAQLRQLLYPIMTGEAVTERRRLELEACLKYPHVLDLQEAFVKRELGEELTEFEELLLRRMDGAVDLEVSQD